MAICKCGSHALNIPGTRESGLCDVCFLQKKIEALKSACGYLNSASHRDGCATEWGLINKCTCGLDAARAAAGV